MRKFLDVHSLKGFEEEPLRKLQVSCREAVENHHNKHGVTCEWISEVKTTA